MSAILSIIIASHSDGDIYNTLDSIRATAGDAVEVIVCDDASAKPVVTDKARVIRTQRRIGVGPARTLGAIHATGDYLLFTDAHVRFVPGWYAAAMERITQPDRDKFLHCGVCLGLDSEHMDVTKPKGCYYGASFNFFGDDANVRGKKQVLESVWLRTEQPDDAEIPSVMGACYIIKRDWFLKLNPLAHLRRWGMDETSMALKVWLANGSVRLLKTVAIGHKFRLPKERVPYRVDGADVVYNKLFIAHTCLPPDKALILQNKFPKGGELQRALQMLHNDHHLVEIERARNQQLFTRSFDEFLARFQLSFPSK